MNPKDILFIVCCVLAILIVIVYSILSSILFKKEQAIKNPYYFCDGSWECCNTENCDANIGKGLFAKAVDSYKPADNWKPGSYYHQNCVLPAQNAALNYDANANHVYNLEYIYEGGSAPGNLPSVYYKGCTSHGGSGPCADPALNPQVEIKPLSCPYVSFDSVPPSTQKNSNGSLLNGTNGYNGGSTLNFSGWGGNSATNYIAGFNGSSAPKNNYLFPYNSKNGESFKNQYTGGSTSSGQGNFVKGNSHNNVLHNQLISGNPTFPNGQGCYSGGGSFGAPVSGNCT